MMTALAIGFGMAAAGADFKPADDLMSKFKFLPKLAFSAGDASGRQHTFQKGRQTMHTRNIMASSSKFPAALAVAGAVQAGHLTFDTPAHDVWPWWTSDVSDNRSAVTLRHLLTLTSGLVSDDFSSCGMPCLNLSPLSNASKYTPEECAREIYHTGPWAARPGKVWSYHSLHLQLAGAMAAYAANLTLSGLLETFLLHKLPMRSSFWLMQRTNPHLAAAMVSTGDDYDKLLQAVLNYDSFSEGVIMEMERDAYETYPGLAPAPNPKDLQLEFYGHYSMCLYFECINQNWSKACATAAIHADPGAFGYWPLVNRQKGYYMQIVVARHVVLPRWAMRLYNVSASDVAALPAQCVSPLRFSLTAPVEKALGKTGGAPPVPYHLPYPLNKLCALAAEAAEGVDEGLEEGKDKGAEEEGGAWAEERSTEALMALRAAGF